MAAENNQESIVSHLSADTDSSTVAIHHTLGPLPFQASPGSHVHDGKDSYRIDYNSLLNLPNLGEADFTKTVKHVVKNGSGSAMTKGQVVYISGADGTNMLVSLADADMDATSATTIGLLEQDLAVNQHGYVVTEGLLSGLDTSMAAAGDPVWLSSTPGGKLYGLANKPHAPVHIVYLGVVTRSQSNNGEIFISVNNGWELDELHNVSIESSVADNEVLAYDSGTSLWKNKTAAEAGLAAASHTHTIANITNLQTSLDGKVDEVPIEIGNAIDLNTFTTTGFWTQSSNAEAAAGTNYPAPYAGLLEVVARADASFVYQRYTTYQLYNRVYHRSSYLGTWSTWREISNVGHAHVIADVTGLATSLAGKADTAHTHTIANVTGLQAALDSKATGEGYTVNRVLVSNGAGVLAVSPTVDTTELGYLNGVTSDIQTQLNGKAANSGYTASRALISDVSGNVVVSPLVSTTELDYLDGVTSNIQTQLNGKSANGHTHIFAEVTGLSTALDNRSLVGHTHPISDVTNLQTTLDDKAPLDGYTANTVLVSNALGSISTLNTVDTTELGYLNGVTSAIQTQLNGKAANSGYTASRALISDASGNVVVSPLVSTTELDYLDGVTSNIQTQLNGKSATGHTHIFAEVTGLSTALDNRSLVGHTHPISDVTNLQSTLDDKAPLDGYTANTVLVSNALGSISTLNTVDTTELGYLNGVTSAIQTQLNGKAANSGYTASRALISDASGNVVVSPLVSTTELDYLDGVTSNIQTQLNGKSATGHTHIFAEVTGLSTALDGKAATGHTHAISDVTNLQTTLDDKAPLDGYTANTVLVSNALGSISTLNTVDTTELGYLNGVTSNLQTQLNAKEVKDLYRFETVDPNLVMSGVGAQTTASVFGTNGVAVEAGTAYLVEGVIYFTAGVVGTSATHSISWGSPSSPATVTRNTWFWNYNSSAVALANAAAMSGVRRPGTTSFQPLNTITMTGTHLFRGAFHGIVEFNAAGNFTPRITVTPTSATVDLTINVGSYIKLQKLGTTISNGTWT